MGFFDRSADIEQTPKLESVLTQTVKDEIARGGLPVIRTGSIFLEKGETCRYVEPAIFEMKVRVPRGTTRRRSHGLFHVRRQEGAAAAARDSVVDITFEQIQGHLYITDDRVLFEAKTDSWERRIDELLVVKPYLNCVKLQFGKDSYKVFVPDGDITRRLLLTLRSAGEKQP